MFRLHPESTKAIPIHARGVWFSGNDLSATSRDAV